MFENYWHGFYLLFCHFRNETRPAEYYAGPSVRGLHVFILNVLETTETKRFDFKEVPGLDPKKEYTVHNMWTHKDFPGTYKKKFEIKLGSHDLAGLLFTEVKTRKGYRRWLNI